MASYNYLVIFLQDVDMLISEIDKLDSKTRLYRKNCEKFGMDFDTRFSISPNCFIDLRDFLTKKIENYCGYDRQIANLRRDFLKNISFIMTNIQREIARIDFEQESQMNEIVYNAVYDVKISNEIKIRDSFDVKSSLFEKFLGIKKYRKLAIENHNLKAALLEREHDEKKLERKNIFELVGMIEDCDVKTGGLLCLQEDIMKAFMIDRSSVKKNRENFWRPVILIPHGWGAKREYYRSLNSNLAKENLELRGRLEGDRTGELTSSGFEKLNLRRLNEKLRKIVGEKIGGVNEA